MNTKLRPHRISIVWAILFFVCLEASAPAQDGPPSSVKAVAEKQLILAGEAFLVQGHVAFVMLPPEALRTSPQPWIHYAPTLAGYPDSHEKWMHEQFLAAGVAVAGIDAGEAYGSPEGQRLMSALHEELIRNRDFAAKPCLLGRSRGGLWASSWAIANPDKVAGIAGIYPVFDLQTYPGLERAAPSYGMTTEQLKAQLSSFNPISKIDVIAKARVPVFIIHGDDDKVVPLKENSATLADRYRQAGSADSVELLVIQGQGHNFWEGFFRCQPLVDFAIEQAKAGAIQQPDTNAIDASTSPANFPGNPTKWHGFDRYDFKVDGHPVLVVAPTKPAPGRPWLWHGEFFGHRPEPDVALLEAGFHIAYMSVPNQLGSPTAVQHWNRFYETLTKEYQLSAKPALIGLSRGGLYCYNWAAANPDKVSCIYGDAPVCDFKSWPGGRGVGKGSPKDWSLVIERYGFADEAEAIAYDKNPIDNLQPLAKAGVPLLHVYGDADDVVPWQENTGLIAQRYQQLGGSITLINKPGVGHHPHGLDDSRPIVDFIIRHAAGH
jgi:pimeloyl-ACP methyl ester carboxylesterase